MGAMSEEAKTENNDIPKYPLTVDQDPVITHHQLGDLKYTATVGMMPIKDEFGEVEAGIFYMAYTKDGVTNPAERNLMFSFNGGPGSASVWLHLGALGPKRIHLNPDGTMPEPPFRLEDNPESWLEHTDLVFIDPVGTGYSRPAKKDGAKKFWSLDGDVESVGEFIRLYITRNQRWASPLHLVGESYGTTRAAGLAGDLMGKGIAFNSIVLVSSVLNFQTLRAAHGNDLPYQLFLPAFAATAWYHKALPGRRSLEAVLKEAETFANGDYLDALNQGDRLSARDRKRIITKLNRLTGLSPAYIESANLRINIHRFCKELLRKKKRTVGRLDSRFVGIDGLHTSESTEHDPSASEIVPAFTAGINDLLTRYLGYQTDVPYYVFNPGDLWKHWSYGDAGSGYPDTSDALRSAMAKNPHLRIMIASGYFDLATPYFATEYTLAHMGLDASVRKNIETHYYEAGHMMYIHDASLVKLKRDVAQFLGG